MQFQFGQYRLDIDVEKNRAFYQNAELLTEGCSCAGCRNYVRAAAILPEEIRSFYDALGIDVRKTPDVYVVVKNPDNSLYYEGFYHLCGRIISVGCSQTDSADHCSDVARSNLFAVTKDHCVYFRDECQLLEKGFPEPAIQMQIAANIPWVLPEKNTYMALKSFIL